MTNLKMTGLKFCKKHQEKKLFHFPQLKENRLKKMNGICLINQVRSRMLSYTSQIADEASFFSYLPFTFFQLPYLEHDLMITNLIRLN